MAAGIVMTVMYIRSIKLGEEYFIKNAGLRTTAEIRSVKEITVDGKKLLTPVLAFAAPWGGQVRNILVYCEKKGFPEEGYPDTLREGNRVNIIYSANNYDCVFIDMGDGTYFGRFKPNMGLITCGITFCCMAVMVYVMLNIMM